MNVFNWSLILLLVYMFFSLSYKTATATEQQELGSVSLERTPCELAFDDLPDVARSCLNFRFIPKNCFAK